MGASETEEWEKKGLELPGNVSDDLPEGPGRQKGALQGLRRGFYLGCRGVQGRLKACYGQRFELRGFRAPWDVSEFSDLLVSGVQRRFRVEGLQELGTGFAFVQIQLKGRRFWGLEFRFSVCGWWNPGGLSSFGYSAVCASQESHAIKAFFRRLQTQTPQNCSPKENPAWTFSNALCPVQLAHPRISRKTCIPLKEPRDGSC